MTDDMLLKDYEPRSELVTPQHIVPQAKFPVVDAHNHLSYNANWEKSLDVDRILAEMKAVNVATVVNLSGGTGADLERSLDWLDRAHPGKFATYCNIDFSGVGNPGWTQKTVAQLEADIKAGARGLKIYKELGLHFHDPEGRLVMPDDPRLSDLWDTAGAAGIPVTIHSADPVAFFRPLDRFNERWDELHDWPDWHFYGKDYPSFEALIDSLYSLIENHPKTNFITAHVGCFPENLQFVTAMMERYPNLYTDIAARIAELGRAPYSSRKWFIQHADRILFGTDFTPETLMYQVHWRFLETADEYFNYSPSSPVGGQGRFCIYGVFLPDEVLEKVYFRNAQRLLSL
jgi:predicted TIM-barrel fold metal-dependent hydrolase